LKHRIIRAARSVRYPDLYCWYVLSSTLDIITTFIIIHVYDGTEANKIANAIFQRHGWPGMILLKYATVVIVLIVCEVVATKKPMLGKGLAITAVCVGALPVLLGAIQVWLWARGGNA
jgi:Domain of unknown function (DUF5658)